MTASCAAADAFAPARISPQRLEGGATDGVVSRRETLMRKESYCSAPGRRKGTLRNAWRGRAARSTWPPATSCARRRRGHARRPAAKAYMTAEICARRVVVGVFGSAGAGRARAQNGSFSTASPHSAQAKNVDAVLASGASRWTCVVD